MIRCVSDLRVFTSCYTVITINSDISLLVQMTMTNQVYILLCLSGNLQATTTRTMFILLLTIMTVTIIVKTIPLKNTTSFIRITSLITLQPRPPIAIGSSVGVSCDIFIGYHRGARTYAHVRINLDWKCY